ncbi:MAG: DUF1826 domain-containing protein [Alphaproteobacteria bacterium]
MFYQSPSYEPDHLSFAFARIAQSDVACVVHERAMPDSLALWLDALPLSQLPDGRVLIRPSQSHDALAAIFMASRTSAGPMRDLLASDIADLTARFSAFSGSAMVDLRLEAVTQDHCWRFHRDNVLWRLLTTYRGAGTEWVEARDAERALETQRDYSGSLNQLQRFAVGMFKGMASSPELAVLHRSPHMPRLQKAPNRQARLLLCLNLPSETSPEPWR